MPGLITTNVDTSGSPPLLCVVNRAAVQALANSTLGRVQWDSEREDAPGWFNAGGTATQRESIVFTVNVVLVATWQSVWQINATGSRYHHMERVRASDGVQEVLIGKKTPNPGGTSDEITESMSWTGRLLAGDSLRCAIFQNSGVSLNYGGFNRSSGNPVASSTNTELSITAWAV